MNESYRSKLKSHTGPSITAAVGNGSPASRARSAAVAAKFEPEESPAKTMRPVSAPSVSLCSSTQRYAATQASRPVGNGHSGASR